MDRKRLDTPFALCHLRSRRHRRPVGLPKVTLTQSEGLATITCSGTKILTETEGGQCVHDDWRGLELFPSPADSSSPSNYTYSWIEDDGVSANPATAEIKLEFSSTKDEVTVKATATKNDFKPLWGNTLWVILPRPDTRKVAGSSKTMLYKGRLRTLSLFPVFKPSLTSHPSNQRLLVM